MKIIYFMIEYIITVRIEIANRFTTHSLNITESLVLNGPDENNGNKLDTMLLMQ